MSLALESTSIYTPEPPGPISGSAATRYGTRVSVARRCSSGGRIAVSAPLEALRGLAQTRNGMIRIATMLATLIMGLIAGPAVSL